MRRAFALCAAISIAVTAMAVVSPAEAGYYVIRWDNTGICQIWNEDLTFKPLHWPSDYKVVSKPVPTLAAAMTGSDAVAAPLHAVTPTARASADRKSP